MKFPLADDHSELDALLEEVFVALDEENIETIYSTLDFFWARLAMHIRAEHLHLFPAILDAIGKPEIATKNNRVPSLTEARKAIDELQNDHNFFMRELLAMIKQLQSLREKKANVEFSEQNADMRFKLIFVKERLETHNRIEETEVYKWLDLLLSSAERDALNKRMEMEITNLPLRFDGKIFG
ncbi:hypothetical protein BH10ACI1_BH10ACI1_35620 [soil metagenome]